MHGNGVVYLTVDAPLKNVGYDFVDIVMGEFRKKFLQVLVNSLILSLWALNSQSHARKLHSFCLITCNT